MWSLLTNSWFKTCIHDLMAFGVVTIISCRRSANESRETNRFLLATYQIFFDDLGHPLTDVEHLVDLKPLLGVTRVQRLLLVLRIFVAEICCHCSAVKTRMKFDRNHFIVNINVSWLICCTGKNVHLVLTDIWSAHLPENVNAQQFVFYLGSKHDASKI